MAVGYRGKFSISNLQFSNNFQFSRLKDQNIQALIIVEV